MRKLLTMFSLWCAMAALCAGAKPACAAGWTTWNNAFKGGTLKLIVPNTISGERTRIEWLVTVADRSTVTTNPIGQNVSGRMRANDVVVVSNSLLLWFDRSNDGTTTVNGGGGMMRGLWPLRRDGSGQLNFRRIINGNNYAPNLFYPGSRTTAQGSGISLLGNYTNVDNGITFAIEHDANAVTTGATGLSINDGGPFSTRDGVFVQFQGRIANSFNSLPPGIGSHYDTDPRNGVEGRTSYTLTYRVPATGDEFRQEVNLSVTQNNLGPLATLVVSNNLAGYDGADVKYGADPSVSGPRPVAIPTNYYSVPGYAVRFYNLAWQDRSDVTWAETPIGQGKLASIGLPGIAYPVPFYEMRPVLNYVPSTLQGLHALQVIDNQGIDGNRVNALDWQLFDTNRGHPFKTWGSGSSFNVIADFSLR